MHVEMKIQEVSHEGFIRIMGCIVTEQFVPFRPTWLSSVLHSRHRNHFQVKEKNYFISMVILVFFSSIAQLQLSNWPNSCWSHPDSSRQSVLHHVHSTQLWQMLHLLYACYYFVICRTSWIRQIQEEKWKNGIIGITQCLWNPRNHGVYMQAYRLL